MFAEEEIFARIEWLVTHDEARLSLRLLYMHETLVLLCHEGIKDSNQKFGNLFAQVDFLCRKNNISVSDTIEIQTARRHSNGRVMGTGRPDPDLGHGTLSPRPDEQVTDLDIHYDCRALAILASAIFKCDIPANVVCKIPIEGREKPKARHIDYREIRCVVVNNNPEEHNILVSLEDGDTQKLVNITDVHAYLHKMVKPDMMLSLADIHEEEDGTLSTRFIVIEPDYLLDISSIAACFKDYGHHPLSYMVSQMTPTATSQPIMLGNYAGAYLDNCIHGATPEHPCATWQETLAKDFADNALNYIMCPDFDAKKYKEDCQRQAENIKAIVAEIKRTAPQVPQMGGCLKNASPADISNNKNILVHPPILGGWGAILEPSFVCPALGIQGRVDLMSEDMMYLVEQKSGKNYNLERHIKGKHGAYQQENHYVQLLLYFAVLHQNFNIPINKLDIRLMYSKFPPPDGLLVVNYYQQLLQEALMVRNRVVASAMTFARDGFTPRYLHALTLDVLNENKLTDRFYKTYEEPQLRATLAPLHNLTPLEEAYFCRMTTFCYLEQAISCIGAQEGTSRGKADIWNMPFDEKMAQGQILIGRMHNAQCMHNAFDETQTLSEIVLYRTDNNEVCFRPGDSVYLYKYNKEEEPDATHAILYKCSIVTLDPSQVVLHLMDPQPLRDDDDNVLWAVEQSYSSSGVSLGLKSLYMLMSAPKERRDLLLGLRLPQFDTSVTLSRSYHPSYDDVLLKAKQAKDYFLLVGPPGTGKTSMAMQFMVKEHLAAPQAYSPLTPKGGINFNSTKQAKLFKQTPPLGGGELLSPSGELERGYGAVLLTSYTNRAIDEICEMLTENDIEFLRIGNPYTCDPQYHGRLAGKVLSDIGNLNKARQYLADVQVVVATTTTLMNNIRLFDLKKFTLTIVDEASQILEPNIIGLLSRLGKFILIGDHKQLPAVVQQSENDSAVTDPLLLSMGLTNCRNSLFERLITAPQPPQGELLKNAQLANDSIDKAILQNSPFGGWGAVLHYQGRMHPDVAAWPNKMFYRDEELQPVPLPHQKELRLEYNIPSQDELDDILKSSRMLFFDVCKENTEGDTDLKSNLAEARLCADLVIRLKRQLGEAFNPLKSIGIIVPYRNQISLIKKELESRCPGEFNDLTIDTVERYQGSQRDIIIFSFTVSQRHQLEFLTSNTFTVHSPKGDYQVDRKLNVALTRARKQMILLGNKQLLSLNAIYRQLIEFCTL